ncbi:ATPase [Motiliproteus sediminis]|uniref:ATPase n=1 Tax=Motiliproteus sediminis TaxID=1468178 RepID=UPI001AEF717F|nr:ATPase [Motiliproteus sediminis]
MAEPSQQQAQHASSGVEALIERLRDQGVKKGQQEAEKLVEEAQRRADWLVSQAREEADAMVKKARDEADKLNRSSLDALRIAARDMNLEIKESLTRSFSDQVRRLVAQQMDNEAFLRQLVLEVVGRVRDETHLDAAGDKEVLLPEGVIGLEELRRNPSEYKDGRLSRLVQSLAGEILSDGVSFGAGKGKGIRVRITASETEVDLSAEAVSEMLLKHLQPRFRAILEGVVK